ncbi:YcgN family cysteine cluster protein [Pseudomonadota bacterium]
MATLDPHFWEHKNMESLSRTEWEALCDGCAKCCLHRLEDEDTREIHFTNVACQLLDQETCHCGNYAERSVLVPDCITLTPKILEDPYWLPSTCAYRLLAEGKALPWWHPLVSGDPDTVFQSGNSVSGRVICETEADNLEHHLIEWVT